MPSRSKGCRSGEHSALDSLRDWALRPADRGGITEQAATKTSHNVGRVRVAVKSVARVGALVSSVLIVLLAATGCTEVVDGAVLMPRPLTGQTVQQVLLAGTDLSNVFDQPFEGGNTLSGGPAIMHGGSVNPGRTSAPESPTCSYGAPTRDPMCKELARRCGGIRVPTSKATR